jgi:hypothetical protein
VQLHDLTLWSEDQVRRGASAGGLISAPALVARSPNPQSMLPTVVDIIEVLILHEDPTDQGVRVRRR